MTPKQNEQLYEQMRLYEMYSIALLAGNPVLREGWSTDEMLATIDDVTQEMIKYHASFFSSEVCKHEK